MKTKLEKAIERATGKLPGILIKGEILYFAYGFRQGVAYQKRLDAAALKREAMQSERVPAKRKARA